MEVPKTPARKDGRIIIHFDYDCFYASVFEAKNPALKNIPFAVQQKQIIVTCNYEARRQGLHKLQLIKDAKRVCPDVVIELGEDLSKFRDASKELYTFIKQYSWNNKIERLGFDEVFMDVTDIVEYNLDMLNRNSMSAAFFQTDLHDPTTGFAYDATAVAGHSYPDSDRGKPDEGEVDELTLRLQLGSHLALHIRHQLEEQKGYTCTVGISTNKLLSKLVGNLNKPKGQTMLLPPYSASAEIKSNAIKFLDEHEIGKIPGIGFKLAQKLREFVLKRPAEFDDSLVYGDTKEKVTVAALRNYPDTNPEMLEKLLSGPGSPHGIGFKIWCLLHGVDDAEVSAARAVPKQISIEDSYIRLDTLPEVLKELTILGKSLITRMRIDLLGANDGSENSVDPDQDGSALKDGQAVSAMSKKWLAHPRTLRLSTRPRQPLQADGTRIRSFKRISHSAPLPTFVFDLNESVEALAEKLVKEALLSLFRKLHPEKAGWNLSLVNLAVTNLAETAGNSKTAIGRDIGNMFRKQEDVLKDFRVTENDPAPLPLQRSDEYQTFKLVTRKPKVDVTDTENATPDADDEDETEEAGWIEGEEDDMNDICRECGLRMPGFAMAAHQRFHLQQAD